MLTGEPPEPPRERRVTTGRPSLVRLAGVFYGVLLACAWLWATWADRPLWYASPESAARGGDPPRDLAMGLVAGVLVILASRAVTLQTGWGDRLGRRLGEVLGPLSWRDCLVLAGLSGVAEEAFFRGALQPAVGYVAASLLFGLAHLAPQRDLLPWTGFTVVAGFLLGALFAASGNLLAPITAHAVINAVNLRFLAVRYGRPDRTGYADDGPPEWR